MALSDFTTPTPPGGGGTGNNGGSGTSGNTGGIGLPPGMSSFGNHSAPDFEEIEDMLINYNEQFKNADPIQFRDDVINTVMSVLLGKKKPNPLLIGPAGCGKTAIVEEIARRIENKHPLIPPKLLNCTIYELPLNSLVSGTKYRGEMEEKLKNLIEFIKSKKGKAILFIDEIHQFMDETFKQTAQALKPELARGSVKLIGSTTVQEATLLKSDPAFNRRFTNVMAEEFTKEQTLEILKTLNLSMFQHYGNRISASDDILEYIVTMADKYKKVGSHRPDNAITLMDRSFGRAVMEQLKLKQSAANNPALQQALLMQSITPLTEKVVKDTAICMMTGQNEQETVELDAIKNELSRIKGQDNIIEKVLDYVERHMLNLFPKDKPLTLMFAGSSGVGKTEVTKIIAKHLTNTKPITINMTEYTHSSDIARIIGAPPGYVGYDEQSELPFDILETNPYQVILLDEFEKGHRSVQRLFMQAFDEGYITNSKNQTIDFSKAIIIATTNAGVENGSQKKIGLIHDDSDDTKESIDTSTLKDWFDTALLNRFTEIISFNFITKDIYKEIITDLYEKHAQRIRQETRRNTLPLQLDDAEAEKIVEKSYKKEFGARPAENAVRKYIEDFMINAKRQKVQAMANAAVLPADEKADVAE